MALIAKATSFSFERHNELCLTLNLHTPDYLIYKTGDAQLVVEPVDPDDKVRNKFTGRFTRFAVAVRFLAKNEEYKDQKN